jgi:MoxR-like ATPase
MLAIVEKTRTHEALSLGVSPRGSQALYRAAQALALVEGREYVIPDDIKRLVVPVFAHRVSIRDARDFALAAQRNSSERTLAGNPDAGRGSVVSASVLEPNQ